MATVEISLTESIILYILSIWSLIWKGLALWRASKQAQRNWFVVLLVLNTAGILDLIYLFRFSHKRLTIAELKAWFKKTFFTKSKSE
jgi:hypothetical protein